MRDRERKKKFLYIRIGYMFRLVISFHRDFT